MAKVNGPFLSVSASGSIGKTLTSRKILRQNVISATPILPKTRSNNQDVVRNNFKEGSDAWNALILNNMSYKALSASAKEIKAYYSAFNFFLGDYVKAKSRGDTICTCAASRVLFIDPENAYLYVVTPFNVSTKFIYGTDPRKLWDSSDSISWNANKELYAQISPWPSGVTFYIRLISNIDGTHLISGLYSMTRG